jgi:hypothetical protein
VKNHPEKHGGIEVLQPEPQAAIQGFNPGVELERIKKLPHSEKREELELYKEKLFSQKEEVAEIEQQLFDELQKNPDAGEAHFAAIVEKHRGKLSSLQKDIFQDAIREAVVRRAAIRELRQKFSDSRELFHHLFGFYPNGRIRISLRALNFRIVVDDLWNAATIIQDAFLERRRPTKQELQETEIIGGKALDVRLAGLPDHSVVVINNSPELKEAIAESGTGWSQNQLIDHEEQHIANIFFAASRLKKYFAEKIQNPDAILSVKEWIALYFKTGRRYTAEWDCKNEILALLRMGSCPDFIKEALYLPDYSPARYRSVILGWIRRNVKTKYGKEIYEENKRFIESSFQEVFGKQLRRIITDGLEAVRMLEQSGIAKNKILLLLVNEPFANWKKFATRYLAQKRKNLPA